MNSNRNKRKYVSRNFKLKCQRLLRRKEFIISRCLKEYALSTLLQHKCNQIFKIEEEIFKPMTFIIFLA